MAHSLRGGDKGPDIMRKEIVEFKHAISFIAGYVLKKMQTTVTRRYTLIE